MKNEYKYKTDEQLRIKRKRLNSYYFNGYTPNVDLQEVHRILPVFRWDSKRRTIGTHTTVYTFVRS